MKKIFLKNLTLTLFSVFFVAGFAACKVEDGDSSEGQTTSADFTVGNEVTIDGDTYLILKNDFLGTESRAAVNSNSGSYYQNEKAEAFRRGKIENEFNIEKYVEAFKISTLKDTATNGIATLTDIYLICNEQNKPVYKISQIWQSTMLFSGTTAETAEQFNSLTENELRENYPPATFTFEARKELYGSDLSKKSKVQYRYEYDVEGTTGTNIDYDKVQDVITWKDFVLLDGKEKSPWRTAEKYDTSENKTKLSYTLVDPVSGSAFCDAIDVYGKNYNFLIQTSGEGRLNGSTSKSVWKSVIKVKSVTSEEAVFTVTKTDNDTSDGGNTYKITYAELTSDSEAAEFISVSSETTELNGQSVPAKVTFTAPFKDSTVELQPYASVSWTPSYDEDTASIVYKPDYDGFVSKYKEAFESLYTSYKNSTKVDESANITLTASTVSSDTIIPTFEFTEDTDTLKIEVEDMSTNFAIVEDSDASGGKAGKLESASSYAYCYVKFPAGTYSAVLCENAPDDSSDALYFLFGDDASENSMYRRVYPTNIGSYDETTRCAFTVTAGTDMTVKVTVQQNGGTRNGENGMLVDYIKFTCN